MNISESVIHVLKNRSSEVFSAFWKEDIKAIFKDITKDPRKFFASVKKQPIKKTFSDVKDSAIDSAHVIKVVPSRIRQGFLYFQEDLLNEMDKFPEQKEKTIFCLKVIGVLSAYTLNTLYGLKKTRSEIPLKGLKIKTAFTHMIATELLVRVTQVFTMRLLNEIEKEMSNPEEIQKLHHFKNLINSSQLSEVHPDLAIEKDAPDRAIAIVESFKTFILTGQRNLP